MRLGRPSASLQTTAARAEGRSWKRWRSSHGRQTLVAASPDEADTLKRMRGPLITALERHLLVYGAGGEKEARRLIEQIAEEVLLELGRKGGEFGGEVLRSMKRARPYGAGPSDRGHASETLLRLQAG